MTQVDLQTFLTTQVFAFLLTFIRMGTTIMIMPGIGNSYVSPNIRLYYALAFSFVLFPMIEPKIPNLAPAAVGLVMLILSEFVIGLFIGSIARILLAAIDIAGLIISTQSSLANAQVFNPAFATQGSVIGGFLTLAGTLLIFVTDLHHLIISAMLNSYELFPIGKAVDFGSMARLVIQELEFACIVGVQMAAPFLIVVFLLYVGMAVMSRLMPQVQVFMIAVPVQIWLALVTLAIVTSTMMLFWMSSFAGGMGMLVP